LWRFTAFSRGNEGYRPWRLPVNFLLRKIRSFKSNVSRGDG